jgi:heme oxygenase
MGSEHLLSGALDRGFYGEHLRALWKAHRALEAALGPWQPDLTASGFPLPDPRLSLFLEQDLQHVHDSLPEAPEEAPEICSKEEGIGALYVIRGSSLGRTMIARALAPTFARWGLPPQAFYSGHRDTLDEWKSFCSRLENVPHDEALRAAVLRGAHKAFDAFA